MTSRHIFSGLLRRLGWIALLGFAALAPLSQHLLGRARPGPLVVMIADHVPLTGLLDRKGDLDRERFPNLARLADRALWFPQAFSVSDQPQLAAGQLLEGWPGRAPRGLALPCSAQANGDQDASRAPGQGGSACEALEAVDPVLALRDLGAKSGPEAVVLFSRAASPPWEVFADGSRYHAAGFLVPGAIRGRWVKNEELVEQARRRHAFGLQSLDRWVGRVLDELEARQMLDRSTVVLAGLRGMSLSPGEKWDELSEGNRGELLRVPVWIKPAGGVGVPRVDTQPLSLGRALGVAADSARSLAPAPASSASGRWQAPFRIGVPVSLPVGGDDAAAEPETGSTVGSPSELFVDHWPADIGRGLVTGRVGGMEAADGVPLELVHSGGVVARTRSFGPKQGQQWFSFLLEEEVDLSRVEEWSIRSASEDGSLDWPIRPAPPELREPDSPVSSGAAPAGFIERIWSANGDLVLRDWAGEGDGRRAAAVSVHSADGSEVYRFRLAPGPASWRFTIALPASAFPDLATVGLQAFAHTIDGHRARLSTVARLVGHTPFNPVWVEWGDGRSRPVVERAVPGAVELARADAFGLRMEGWAFGREDDLEILVFRDRKLEAVSRPTEPRPDLTPWFGECAEACGFVTTLGPGQRGELVRLVALPGEGPASLLPVARPADAVRFAAFYPETPYPRVDDLEVGLDPIRVGQLLPPSQLGWLDVVEREEGRVRIAGWAADPLSPSVLVVPWVEGRVGEPLLPRVCRPGPARLFGRPGCVVSGFDLELETEGQVRLFALSPRGVASELILAGGSKRASPGRKS